MRYSKDPGNFLRRIQSGASGAETSINMSLQSYAKTKKKRRQCFLCDRKHKFRPSECSYVFKFCRRRGNHKSSECWYQYPWKKELQKRERSEDMRGTSKSSNYNLRQRQYSWHEHQQSQQDQLSEILLKEAKEQIRLHTDQKEDLQPQKMRQPKQQPKPDKVMLQ